MPDIPDWLKDKMKEQQEKMGDGAGGDGGDDEPTDYDDDDDYDDGEGDGAGGEGEGKSGKGKGKGEGEEEEGGKVDGTGEGIGGILSEEESIKIQKELGVPVEVGTKADAEKMIEEAIKGKKHLESNKNRGSGKGLLQRAIDRYAKPQVDWKSELRRIIGKMVTRREEYFGKRKYLHRDEYVYGERVSANTLKDAIMAVDTSGSIGDDELRVMLGEIAAIIKSKKIHRTEIVYFDAALQGHDVVKNPPQFDWTKATGGGGTSFIPPIDYIAQQYKRNKMELCVFCTDGYGDQEKLDPKPKFAQKFIWLIIDNPGWVPPFGKVVYVKTKKGK
jgi:predicted metal-dependent peptidase